MDFKGSLSQFDGKETNKKRNENENKTYKDHKIYIRKVYAEIFCIKKNPTMNSETESEFNIVYITYSINILCYLFHKVLLCVNK